MNIQITTAVWLALRVDAAVSLHMKMVEENIATEIALMSRIGFP